MTAFPTGTILGYPRIGRRRELKNAVESFWAGRIDEAALEADRGAAARADAGAPRSSSAWAATTRRSPSPSPTTTRCSTPRWPSAPCPTRFAHLVAADGTVGLAALLHDRSRRGRARAARDDQVVRLELPLPRARDRPRDRVLPLAATASCARSPRPGAQGFTTRPVVVGPVTLLALSKASDAAPEGYRAARSPRRPAPRLRRAARAARRRRRRVGAARRAGARQRVAAGRREDAGGCRGARLRRARRCGRPPGDLRRRPVRRPRRRAAGARGDARRGDRGRPRARATCRRRRGSRGQDARRRRRRRPQHLARRPRRRVRPARGAARRSARPWRPRPRPRSCTCPTTSPRRPTSTSGSCRWLAFADQKVAQVADLARGLAEGRRDPSPSRSPRHPPRWPTASPRRACATARCARAPPPSSPLDFDRGDYAARQAAQDEALDLPALPTTTIGSFPQTADIRARARPARQGRAQHGGVRGVPAGRDLHASSGCRRSSGSTCSCTASPSATTWCSTSPRTSTGSR